VRLLAYTMLVLVLVPIQVGLGSRISIAGVNPDLPLIAVCLIGLFVGEMEALWVGVALGFTQDLLSGGLFWGNLCLKPVIGLLAGLASRSLVNLTAKFAFALLFALSIFSGAIMFALKSMSGAGADFFVLAREIILPQACFDAVLGVAVFKLIQHWAANRNRLTAMTYE
jgi:rod shape-determining protein MreD